MKSKKQIITALLFLTLVIAACTKPADPELAEFYMHQYRDPELFGIWQSINVKTSYIHYYKEGYYHYTKPKYNKKGEVIGFNNKKREFYYYTKPDTIYTYSASTLKGGGSFFQNYKVKNDTLFISSTPNFVRIGD